MQSDTAQAPASKNAPSPKVVLICALIVFFLSSAVTIYVAISQLTSHNWKIPAQGELRTATGTFARIKADKKAPYAFKTNTGTEIDLSCYPRSKTNDCIDGMPLDAPPGSGLSTQIGYFYTRTGNFYSDYVRSSSPNILMTAHVPGSAGLSYEMSWQRLQRYSSYEDAMGAWFLLIADLAPVFFASISGWISIAAIKALGGKRSNLTDDLN